MVDSTWTTRELPILEAVIAAQERGDDVNAAARTAVDIDGKLYGEVVDSLRLDGYLDAIVQRNGAHRIFAAVIQGPLPRARRAVGQWPSEDAGTELVRVLEDRMADATPEERSKLERARDALQSLGGKLLTSIAIEYVKRETSLG